jgi:glycosyltransferase involved in cell wall biosynthesis
MVDMVTHGIDGLLSPPGDVTALRDNLERILGDVSLEDRIAQGARMKVRQFTASSVAERLEKIYQEVAPA